MAYTSVDYSLNHLDRLLSTPDLTFSKESKIHMLKLEFSFLRTFLRGPATRCLGNGSLEDLSQQIELVARNAVGYLNCVDDIVKDLEKLASQVLENIKPLKPNIEQVYILLVKSSASSSTAPMPEKLVELINYLIKNLNDLIKDHIPSSHPVRKELGALQMKLRFLKNLLKFAATRCIEHEKLKDLSTHTEVVAVQASYLSFMCSFDPINEDIKEKLAQLLRKIEPISPEIGGLYVGVLEALRPLTAETRFGDADLATFIETLQDYLTELLNNQPSWMASLNDKIEDLHHELPFLSSFVKYPSMQFFENGKWHDPIENPIEIFQSKLSSWSTFDAHSLKHYELPKLKDQLTRIEALAIQVGCAIFSNFYVSEVEEDKPMKASIALVDFVEKIKLIKEDVGVPMLALPKVNIIRTDDLGFINYVLRYMRELLDRRVFEITSLKRQVKEMTDEVEFLSKFMRVWGDMCEEHEELESFVYIAYKAEHVIDLFLVRNGPVWYHSLCLIDLTGEMKRIKRKVMGIYDKMTRDFETKIADPIKSFRYTAAPIMSTAAENQLVTGFEEVGEYLIPKLIQGSREFSAISIVGMAGLGRRSLARRIYEDDIIVHHFDLRAFIELPQIYETRELLLQMLGYLTGHRYMSDEWSSSELSEWSSSELSEMLHKILKGRRFLIVMTDLWEISICDDLRVLFPDDKNGSRILLTTRVRELAFIVSNDNVLHLRLLDLDESWKLLESIIFQQESCPPELEDVAKKIAIRCGGLPINILLVGGILARIEKDLYWWIKVLNSLLVHEYADPMSFLELSYQNLQEGLRQCFLYFGAFPMDEKISASKLIRLWNAEGFIQETKELSLEDVGMNYLMELIGRNLIEVCRKSSDGRVKSCKPRDLVHDFCLRKATDENMFRLRDRYSTDDPNYSNIPNSAIYEHRRMCITSDWEHFISSGVSGPLVRSLVLTGRSTNYAKFSSDISSLSQNFKFLKVLDLACVNVGNAFPVGLEKMILLRYLAVRGEMTSIPASIVSLQQLETFVTIGLSGEIAVPDAIWRLTNLRHLHINDRASFGAPEHSQGYLEKSPNLKILSTPFLGYGEDSLKIMRRLTSLKKLKCIFLQSWDSSTKKNMFPQLDFLLQLESLKLFYYGRVRQSCEFNFPANLRRLTLSRFRLPWSEISTIGILPNLEVLKLLNKAFEGSQWEIEADKFPQLKFLKLDRLNVEKWLISDGALPCLERLELQKCKKLKEIPLILGENSTLEVIEVYWCSQSVEYSALRIRQEQEDMGNNLLKVSIPNTENV